MGDYAKGRLLLSPWSAFKAVFPMHGTYFFQNEVFEDEVAGEVRVPLASLGRRRPVYLGRSVEGVLRSRSRRELQLLFRYGFVCIRRFRSSDCRLLPLVLDGPRLLKYNLTPSPIAVEFGLQPATKAVGPGVAAATGDGGSTAGAPEQRAGGGAGTGAACSADRAEEAAEAYREQGGEPPAAPLAAPVLPAERSGAADPAGAAKDAAAVGQRPSQELQQQKAAARARGLRLFSLYVAAGGALCMQQTVWRRIMPSLHPDRGGDVDVFQQIGALKRQLDAGETIEIPSVDEGEAGPESAWLDSETAGLIARIKADLAAAAQS